MVFCASAIAAVVADQPNGVKQLDRPNIRGTVTSIDGAAIGQAVVVIVDAESGLPLCSPGWVTFAEASRDETRDPVQTIVYAQTDDQGQFVFKDVPPGRYRLIAQRWPSDKAALAPLAEHTATVEMLGQTKAFSVTDVDIVDMALRPEGKGTLTVRCESANNETLLVLSTGATRADPILSFAGWSGPFMKKGIAWNRMPSGETTFIGLPDGTYHAAIFSADNNPGFGQGTVEVKEDHRTTIELNWVAAWSNGMHAPPPTLVPTVQLLRASAVKTPDQLVTLLESQDIPFPKPQTMLEYLSMATPLVGRKVRLNDDAAAIEAQDLLAAFGYISMEESLKAQGRTPNAWRAPKVTVVPIEEPVESTNDGG